MEKRGSFSTNEKLDKPPKLIQTPDSIYRIKEGTPVTLEAIVDAQPEADFQWRQNNFEAHSGKLIKVERVDKNWSRVTFDKPAGGQYEVIAKNCLGHDSAVTKIIVEYEDSATNLEKLIFNEPKIEKSKKVKETNDKEKKEKMYQSSLVKHDTTNLIDNVQIKTDILNLQKNENKPEITLDKKPPCFVKELNELFSDSIVEGTQLHIDIKVHCLSEKNEPVSVPKFQWILNNQQIPLQFIQSTEYLSTLSVPKIKNEMSGNLKVIATNCNGSASSSTIIRVTPKG